MRAILLAIAIAILAGAPASAQPAPSAPRLTPTAEALAEADALLTATKFEEQMTQTARLTAGQTMNTVLAQAEARVGERMPADLRADFERIVGETMDRIIERLRATARPQVARIYASYFTAPELRELRALLSSPVMVKLTAVTPQLTAELTQVGMASALAEQESMEARLEAAVTDWAARERARGKRS